jgi:hypothetical protein
MAILRDLAFGGFWRLLIGQEASGAAKIVVAYFRGGRKWKRSGASSADPERHCYS